MKMSEENNNLVGFLNGFIATSICIDFFSKLLKPTKK